MIKPILLLFSLLFIGCKGSVIKEKSAASNKQTKQMNCVERILEKDSIYGATRNHDTENGTTSEAINNYAENLKSLDFSDCPAAFKLAFDEHIEAWLDFRNVSDKHPTLRGELHDIFAIIEKSEDSTEYKSRLNLIWDTWKTVEESSKQ